MATNPDELLRAAEDEIERWWCELDDEHRRPLDEARRVLATASADAAEIVAAARVEAELIIADAQATAGEHADVIRALTTAEREAAGDELESLREAVVRLRTELSRVVDAAFDALPAVEATAGALDHLLGTEPVIDLTEPEPARTDFELVGAGAPAPRRRFLRRLFHRH